jgi:sterol desaturase/sphingolipid hydroxylase (fatty acid hydroxylase superfamily)
VGVWHWVFAFVIYDFCYYLFHRLSHERKIFWAAHVAHHQSEEYNLSTALRQTSMSFLLSWVFYIPCFLIGMPAEMFVSVASINLIYQFWVHTRFIPELGPVEWLLVTPSNHRVHHARNANYIDKNYGGVFIVWDRLLGSYKREDKNEAADYGITRGLNSWNPLWANLHVYWSMLQDSRATRSWADKWKVWFGRTAYVPADIDKGPLSLGKRYNPSVGVALRNYILVQFLLAVGLAVVLIYLTATLAPSVVIALFFYLLLSLITFGWLFESKHQWVEYLRLGLLPLLGFLVYQPVLILLIIVALVSLLAFYWLAMTSRRLI